VRKEANGALGLVCFFFEDDGGGAELTECEDGDEEAGGGEEEVGADEAGSFCETGAA